MQAVVLPRHRLVAERRGKVEWKQSSDFFFNSHFIPDIHNFYVSFLHEVLSTWIS